MELNIKISRSVCWLILTLLAALFGFRLYKRHCATIKPKPEAQQPTAAAEQPFAPHIVVEQAGESSPQKETPAARTGTGGQPAASSPFASRQFGGSSRATSTKGRKTAAERAAEGDEAAFKAGLEAMHAARYAKPDQSQPTEEFANAGR